MKYGMPCFCVGKKAFCYLWIDKKTEEPYVLFVDGNRLNHPHLEKGSRARMKIYRIDKKADINIVELNGILSEAISLHI